MNHERKKLAELLGRFDTAVLVSQRNRRFVAKPLAIADSNRHGDLWFVTSLASSEVDALRAGSEAAAIMQGDDRYLAISGTAHVIDDHEMINALWKDEWSRWFDTSADDPFCVLIQFSAVEAEYWDRHATHGVRYVFEAAKAALRGDSVDPRALEDHGNVPL